MPPVEARYLPRSPGANWVHGAVQFRVMLSLGVDGLQGSQWDSALWDEGEWSSTEPTWIDITGWALAVTTSIGKDRFEQQARTGSMTVDLDNQSGIFNPIAGETGNFALTLRPGRWIRIEATYGEGWKPVFTGYVSALQDQYWSAAHGVNTRVTCIGFLGALAIFQPPPLDTPVGAGELTGARVNRILDRYGFNGYPKRAIDPGLHTLQETSLGAPLLTEAQSCEQAEGGLFYMDQDAVAVFRQFDYLETDPRSTAVQYRIGGPASDVDPIRYSVDWSADRIRNDIQMQAVDGEIQRAVSLESIVRYLLRTYKLTGLDNDNDLQVADLATRYLERFAFDRIRIDEVATKPGSRAEAKLLLDTRIGDLLEATVQTATEQRWSYTSQAHVFRISHSITADDWEATLRLDDAATNPPGDQKGFSIDGFSDGFH